MKLIVRIKTVLLWGFLKILQERFDHKENGWTWQFSFVKPSFDRLFH